MTRRAARVDANHAEIVRALRQVGASVQSLARQGDDCPDILVGFRKKNYVWEIKTAKGKLKPGQQRWLDLWCGEAQVVRSVDEAFQILGIAAINP